MAADLENSSTGLTLVLAPYDPSGSAHLPADALTGARLGCHVLSVPTALLVRDTAQLESIQPLSEDTADDQARCLLEDVNIQAIKCGPVYSPEMASMVAGLCADYPELPLVLHLSAMPAGLDDIDAEDALDACLRLLLPLSALLVVDHASLEQWQADGMLEDGESAIAGLLGAGGHAVLCTGAPGAAGQWHFLFHGHHGQLSYTLPRDSNLRQQDLDSLLAAACACRLAQGMELDSALESALNHLQDRLQDTFQPGMGHRLFNHATNRHD
ncbi:bifunctional hydroxymethylpyrimidine kinase/phosphomethylpyrimidine kinase [Alcaligenes sp. SDU_A2]|uniref:bifunctional hydroxymethylpyrimidine kinase/phosphomethylpyrimidine kinase n=1 Tax=Alcaligenes sp. SDU_A2 TaxID=3136634 RepID=UPI00311D63D2